MYDDAYFTKGGAGYPDYLAEEHILREHGRRYATLMSQFVRPAAVLDVGCAAGFILESFVRSGWRGIGVEPNGKMAAHARANLGLGVHEGTLDDLPRIVPVELVLWIQVVGHLVDPVAAFGAAARVTRPGGYWLIETWNPESWTARVLNAYWHEYSPPSVLHLFPPRALAYIAGRFGFHRVASGRPFKWVTASHAKALLARDRERSWSNAIASSAAALLPSGARLPYLLDDIYWELFRSDAGRGRALSDDSVDSGLATAF